MKKQMLFIAITISINGFTQSRPASKVIISINPEPRIRMLQNVQELPSGIVSIEKAANFIKVEYTNGKIESFDPSDGGDQEKFEGLFGTILTPLDSQLTSPLKNNEYAMVVQSHKVLSAPLSQNEYDVLAIETTGNNIFINTIPADIAQDGNKLEKWLKRYKKRIVHQ